MYGLGQDEKTTGLDMETPAGQAAAVRLIVASAQEAMNAGDTAMVDSARASLQEFMQDVRTQIAAGNQIPQVVRDAYTYAQSIFVNTASPAAQTAIREAATAVVEQGRPLVTQAVAPKSNLWPLLITAGIVGALIYFGRKSS